MKNTMNSSEIAHLLHTMTNIPSIPIGEFTDFAEKQWLSKDFVEKCIDEEMCSQCREKPCDWCKMMITLKQKLGISQ